MVTELCGSADVVSDADAGQEIIQILAGLARRSRREGLTCASEALDQAVIAVFNALFVDRAAKIPQLTEDPQSDRVGRC